ncbi:hypothetical protein A2U01_0114228, partial [Trifolium medium]|nr:hypothetical protein [Trifolium medium]
MIRFSKTDGCSGIDSFGLAMDSSITVWSWLRGWGEVSA